MSGVFLHKYRLLILVALTLVLFATTSAHAGQRGARGGPRGGPPPTARASAPIDLTGYWVAVIAEDWRLRMVTPQKGNYDTLTLNAEGRRVGDTWDPDRDEKAGEQCKAYGAASIMRLPGRLHITWENDATLRIDTDTGNQTRRFHFDAAKPAEPTSQGHSQAAWQFGPTARGGAPSGSLKVITTNLRAGYIRKNGAPHSDKATVTEYFDINTMPNGDQWITITTRIDDPVYFTRPYITTTDFKKLANGAGWDPTPCSAK
jgi:hypothetical protein